MMPGRSGRRNRGGFPREWRAFFAALGPGLITGAADDDPSGISTYSVTDASFGYAPLWTALFSFPLMAAVQLMCARLGMVTGRGLAGVVRRRYPRSILWGACTLLVIANVFNIAADLGGMAEATAMVTGVPSKPLVVVYGAVILALLFFSTYRQIARIFKWLTLVLFAYVIAAFLAHPDWPRVVRATFIPHVEWSAQYLATFVAVLGTTISPYLFFWQASQEVEEEKARGRRTAAQRRGATPHELADARLDVNTGMFFSNVVMYFIILATAATLNRSGFTEIATAREAAEALRPLAGNAAYLLFALGLIGTGLLAVPVLAGSASFAVAEVFGWRSGLDLSPRRGRHFYLVFAGAIAGGMLLDLFQTNPIRMLFLSAVLNGILAPPLLVLVMLVSNDAQLMGEHTNGVWLNVLGWGATAVMTAAAAAFFLTSA